MKKFSIILVLICAICLLGGCADIDFQLIINANGVITERLYLPLNQQYFLEAGATNMQISELRVAVLNLAREECSSRIQAFEEKVDADDEITPENKEILKSSISAKQQYNDEYILIDFNFLNTNVRNYYYNVDSQATSNTEVQNGFLTTKTITTSKTKFASTVSGTPITEYYAEQFETLVLTIMPGVYNSLPEPSFTYTYVTSSSRLRSDADDIQIQNGYYLHIWNLEGETEKEISLYYTRARTEIWYALILGISLLACGTMFLVYFIKNKKNKQKAV